MQNAFGEIIFAKEKKSKTETTSKAIWEGTGKQNIRNQWRPRWQYSWILPYYLYSKPIYVLIYFIIQDIINLVNTVYPVLFSQFATSVL